MILFQIQRFKTTHFFFNLAVLEVTSPKSVVRAAFLLEASGEAPGPCQFHLPMASCFLWLVLPHHFPLCFHRHIFSDPASPASLLLVPCDSSEPIWIIQKISSISKPLNISAKHFFPCKVTKSQVPGIKTRIYLGLHSIAHREAQVLPLLFFSEV